MEPTTLAQGLETLALVLHNEAGALRDSNGMSAPDTYKVVTSAIIQYQQTVQPLLRALKSNVNVRIKAGK